MDTPDTNLDDFLDEADAEATARRTQPKVEQLHLEDVSLTPTVWTPGMRIVPGFYEMSAAMYHSQDPLPVPALSYSIAKLLVNECPKHGWYSHRKLGGGAREDSNDMDFGSMAHTLILGKGAELAVGDYPDWRTNAAKDFRETARREGRTPVLLCKLNATDALVQSFAVQVTASDAAGFYSESAHTEIAAFWQYEGVYCQNLFDRVDFAEGTIYDVKTTSDVSPKTISRQIINMGYDVQSEFYRLALETLVPSLAGRTRFVFLFVETAPPYCVTPIELSGEGQALGQMKVDRAFKIWQECIRTGLWPGYASDIITAEVPAWALSEEMGAELARAGY